MKKLITLVVLVLCLAANSQTNYCLTDAVLQNEFSLNPLVKERVDLMNSRIREISKSRDKEGKYSAPFNGTVTIPVVVYIVHNGEPLGEGTNLADERVAAQISVLNNKFSSIGIKFCLATRAGIGSRVPYNEGTEVQNTPGIIHINNPDLSDHTTDSEIDDLLNTANPQVAAQKFLRIWVVKKINDLEPNVAGYAWLPNSSSIYNRDGIVVISDVFGDSTFQGLLMGYRQGEVMVHEVGHYLGLYHTFEGGCAITSDDPYANGDLVLDTPKVAEANFSCQASTDSCIDGEGFDLIQNYMDYGNDDCKESFTDGQKIRMQEMLTNFRSELVAPENLLYTGTCGSKYLLSAQITPSKFTICSTDNNSILFSALDAPGNPWTYSWDFGDPTGSDPNTSTSQNALHTYTNSLLSPYTITLSVTGETEEGLQTTVTSSIKIYVTDCQEILNSETNWYINPNFSLSFKTGIPEFGTDYPISNWVNGKGAIVSTKSESSSPGRTLFYTNGLNIWDSYHQIVNTQPSLGDEGYINERVLIVPSPASENRFYVFNNDASSITEGVPPGELGLRYSSVDIENAESFNVTINVQNKPITLTSEFGMSSANGFEVSNFDGALLANSTFTAIKKCDGYWMLVILRKGSLETGFTSYIVVFSLTSAGLLFNNEYLLPALLYPFTAATSLKVSPSGNKLFCFQESSGYFGSPNIPIQNILVDFNKYDGKIENPKSVLRNTLENYPNYLSAASFSPDSNLLYICETNVGVSQYNVNSGDVNASRRLIGTANQEMWGNSDIEQGPDDKLYIAGQKDRLAVIHNPNKAVTTENSNSCNFSKNGPVKSQGQTSFWSGKMPNFINAKQETAYFPAGDSRMISAYIEGCNKYKFFPNYDNSTTCSSNFKWVITNTTTDYDSIEIEAINPIYQFTANGVYEIVLIDSDSGNTLGSTDITVSDLVSPTIVGSSAACSSGNALTNNSVPISSLSAGQTVQWEIAGGTGTIANSNTESSVTITWQTLPGQIQVSITDLDGCVSTAIKNISFECPGVGANDIVYTTKLQPDGKIVMGGKFTAYYGNPSNRVARLNTDMTFDNTFAVGTGADNTVLATAIQSDGKVLIGGTFTTYNGVSSKGIARLNTNGSLDITFTVGTGVQELDYMSINAIAVQNDGKILIGGNFTSYDGSNVINIARLNSNGTIDNTFSSSFTSSSSNEVNCIVIQSDGKIIIGGGFTSYGISLSSNIARLNPNGSKDLTFNTGIGFTAPFAGVTTLYSLKLQSDGKILAGGTFALFNGISIRDLARIDVDGSLDNTFIPAPIATIAGGAQGVRTVDIQTDNKIVIGGGFLLPNKRIARLTATGAFDPTFNTGSTGFLPFGGSQNPASALFSINVQPDGKFVTAGFFTSYNEVGINNITRLDPSVVGGVARITNTNIAQLNEVNQPKISNALSSEILIYPNPLSNYFVVTATNQKIDFIEVYDIMGRLILSQSIKNSEEKVSMDRFTSGTYYVKIYNQFSLLKSEILIKK